MTINKKAFTLIELLVVIAIIGILSGLIIVSMSGTTNTAKDSRIKEEMHQFQSIAAIYNTQNNGYGSGVAGASTNFTGVGEGLNLYNDLISASLGSKTITLAFGTNTYCISIPLNVSGVYCMDSTGKIGTSTCDAGACP